MPQLHKLGWSNFQQLCLAICREVLGQTVESFLDSNDGGRDGAFKGTWSPRGGEHAFGSFVIQCKYTSRPNKNVRLADLSDEISKAERLVARGMCDTYVLLTNAGLSGEASAQLGEAFQAIGVETFLAYGSTWIETQILENKRLRMLVPRLYGLGDLSQILDERVYDQAVAVLESMREDLSKVVLTRAYRNAVQSLNDYGFVLLTGEPASGKSTIASLLAISAMDQWGSTLIKATDTRDLVSHWNPHEPTQFFWFDDAFGVTQYDASRTKDWNYHLPQLRAMLNGGVKIVLTARDYIYRRARLDLKTHAFPLLNEAEVVIDAQQLSIEEREEVLYNHLKMGRQPREFLSRVKPHLDSVAANDRFIPEIARRLGDPFFTKGMHISEHSLNSFVNRREQLLDEIVTGLDAANMAAIGLVFIRRGNLKSPVQLEPTEGTMLHRLGSHIGDVLTSLVSLDGSLLMRSTVNGEPTWTFRHPTIGDAYSRVLVKSPEHIETYLLGSRPESMLFEVTCGDVGIEKALIVPRSHYHLVEERLQDYLSYTTDREYWRSQSLVHSFLARRCADDFLVNYVQAFPRTLNDISSPGLYLSYSSEVALAERLFNANLLPEEYRRRFVETVNQYLLRGEDPGPFGSDRVRALYSDEEISEARRKTVKEVVPYLTDLGRDFISGFGNDEEPTEYISPFIDYLGALVGAFSEDADIVEALEGEIDYINDWAREQSRDEDPEQHENNLETVDALLSNKGERSIFDDIDL